MPISQIDAQETFMSAMQRVYLWMGIGLFFTAVTAFFVFSNGFLFNIAMRGVWIFFILELILVMAIRPIAMKMSPTAGLIAFFGYSVLNGVTMSAIFWIYDLGTIWMVFGVTAVTFGAMSLIGYFTKQDLSHWGTYLMMGLVGFIVASVANFFFRSPALDWIISYVGVALFLGLTVYDTNRIKKMTYALVMAGDQNAVMRVGVIGALHLYLDFINLFLLLLRILGRRR